VAAVLNGSHNHFTATKVTKQQTPGAIKEFTTSEISRVLVRVDHVASIIVNVDHSIA
jgi:hypothetical protein